MLAALDRTMSALDPGRPTPEQRTAYRSPEEIAPLFGDGVEIEPLDVEAGYSSFDELWESVLGGAGPAGVWAKEPDDERREMARVELHRQVGEPSGAFTLRGRAWGARIRLA